MNLKKATLSSLVALGLLALAQVAVAADDPLSRAAEQIEAGKFGEALDDALKALAVDPEDGRGHLIKGRALRGLGRFDEAAAAFRKATLLCPPASALMERSDALLCETLLLKARREIANGQLHLALDTLNDALIVDTSCLEALLLRGDVLIRSGRDDEGWQEYDIAIERAPNHPSVLSRVAAAHLALGRSREAREFLETLVSAASPPADSPTRSWAHLMLGRILEEEGKMAEALRRYKAALNGLPENREAGAALDRIEAFRDLSDRVVRRERSLFFASVGLLAVYLVGGALAWRFLRKRGWA